MAVLAILSATGTLGAASWLIAKVRRWQADSRLADLGAAREFRLPGTDRLVEGPLLLALPNGTGMDLRAAAAVAIGKGGMIRLPDGQRAGFFGSVLSGLASPTARKRSVRKLATVCRG